jgi:hypothetical protein
LSRIFAPQDIQKLVVRLFLSGAGQAGLMQQLMARAAEEEIFVLTTSIPIPHPQVNKIPSEEGIYMRKLIVEG